MAHWYDPFSTPLSFLSVLAGMYRTLCSLLFGTVNVAGGLSLTFALEWSQLL